MMKKFIFSIVLLNVCLYASSQIYSHFYHLNTKDGLSSNSVCAIYKDKLNYVWIATSNGLDRYDGARMKHYNGFYNNSVWLYNISDIQEDAFGNLIIDRYNYIVYDRKKDIFYDDLLSYLRLMGIYRKDVPHRIKTDKKGNLWLSYNDGILYCNLRNRKRIFYSLNNMSTMTVTKDNAYVITKSGTIFTIPINDGKITKDRSLEYIYKKISACEITFFVDNHNNKWIYSKGTNNGIYYQENGHHWKLFSDAENADYRIKGRQICNITEDGFGNIWIAIEHNGINIFSYKDREIISLQHGSYGILSNRINTLYCDATGTVWIGYLKNGITFVPSRKAAFETHFLGGNDISEYKNDIAALMVDKEGNLWVGTDGYGLSVFNRELNKEIHYDLNKKINVVACLYEDRKGRVWTGTYEDGIYCFDHGKRIHYNKGDKGLADNSIWSITEDTEGNLWIGGLNKGTQKWQDKGGYFEKAKNNNIWLSKLCKTYGNNLLCATYGYSTLDTRNAKIGKSITGNRKNTQQFSDKEIRDMCYDSHGLLWMCGKRGISIYDQRKDTIYYITHEDGLCNDVTQGIIEDVKQHIWVTTDDGISQILARRKADSSFIFFIKNYSRKDGLMSSSFNQHAICTDRNGNVYVGGSEGFAIYRPGHSTNLNKKPTVLFTDIQIGNKYIIPDSLYNENVVITSDLNNCRHVRLNYSDRMITFYFASPDCMPSGISLYAYRLEPSPTSEWIYSTEGKVTFDNLSSGQYMLKVKVRSNDGLWSDVSTTSIIVDPPYWKSWWAILIYIAIICLFMYYILHTVHRRQKEKMNAQKIKMELDKQRHINNMKFEFFTNVSHDFRTPLSLIITPIEKLIEDNKEKPIVKTLSTIHRNALQLTDMVNQLLSFSKLDEAGEKIQLSSGDYISFVKEICNEFALYQNRKIIKLKFCSTINDLTFDFDKEKVRKIMTNLLSNAFKFSPKNSVITVCVESDGEKVKTSVNDNGTGISERDKKKVFERFYQVEKTHLEFGSGIGLHIVSQYVSLLNGTITLTDNQPCGSRFCFTLPLISNPSEVTDDKNDMSVFEKEPTKEDNKLPSILIVEDNDDFLNFIDECLNNDYLISKATNGAEALKILRQENINIIISDIMMPVMDGFELCRKVKTDITLSHIPLILLTAKTAEEHKVDGLRNGADDYLTKPFNLNILKLRIEKLLQWSKSNHEAFTNKMDIKPSEITISSLDEELIKKTIKAVEDNMGNSEFSVEDLGKAVGLSRGHLYRKLMEITGRGPLDFIRILRLKRAKQYLKESQMTVSEIAYIVGFNTPKIFSKYFKEEFKISPSEYKEKTKS